MSLAGSAPHVSPAVTAPVAPAELELLIGRGRGALMPPAHGPDAESASPEPGWASRGLLGLRFSQQGPWPLVALHYGLLAMAVFTLCTWIVLWVLHF